MNNIKRGFSALGRQMYLAGHFLPAAGQNAPAWLVACPDKALIYVTVQSLFLPLTTLLLVEYVPFEFDVVGGG